MAKEITKRSVDFSRWYTDVIGAAQMADYAPVKGCMVIRPYGFALWENLKAVLDGMIKETGHENAYFPIFIPESFLKREKEHVEGFSPECAVVTYAGQKNLEERLVLRPTSETIMYTMYAQWIESWRDLPLLINQWANVIRWELRTRLFLRTTEFLWQEGHTAHETEAEAEAETLMILGMYRRFLEEYLAIPVLHGLKSESEKFAGALRTYCIEALTQECKSLQAGTSHNLGQNFSKAFHVQFTGRDGTLQYAWQTSWGVSTRLIGAIIMVHGDDRGVVLPPRLAPIQAVGVPIYKSDEERERVIRAVKQLEGECGNRVRFKADLREEHKPGWKFFEWEKKGVPLRIELGPRDLDQNRAVVVRRDSGEKIPVERGVLLDTVEKLLEEIQKVLFEKALRFREENTYKVDTYEVFKRIVEERGGFLRAHWCGRQECEEKIKEETKASIRVIPLKPEDGGGECVLCREASPTRVYFAKAY